MTKNAVEILKKRYVANTPKLKHKESESDVSCDNCDFQDPNDFHYCLLFGIQIKNMDITYCDRFQEKES